MNALKTPSGIILLLVISVASFGHEKRPAQVRKLSAFSYLYGNQTIKIMQDTEEKWLPVVGYEGIYEVSNLGRVKSLSRKVHTYGGRYQSIPEKIISTSFSAKYVCVSLSKDGNHKTVKVHLMVAMAFKGHIPNGHKMVINHKDFNKTNNRESNLEIIPHRKNSDKKHIPHSSKYTGVHWDSESRKWRSVIGVDGKRKDLGRFKDEYQAHLAYENALKSIS